MQTSIILAQTGAMWEKEGEEVVLDVDKRETVIAARSVIALTICPPGRGEQLAIVFIPAPQIAYE